MAKRTCQLSTKIVASVVTPVKLPIDAGDPGLDPPSLPTPVTGARVGMDAGEKLPCGNEGPIDPTPGEGVTGFRSMVLDWHSPTSESIQVPTLPSAQSD